MEEIEYKLKKKNNPISIVNAISKLIDTIQIKADSGHVTELVEFKLLKSKCEDKDSILSITACQGLVTLVETGVLGVLPTLSGFIAALSTVRNFTGIIPAIGSLLILDLKFRFSNNEVYKCPFTLRTPQHPFITILKQKKEVWLDVFNQIQFMCQHKEDIVANNSVELLRPVLLFILCDPCQTRDLPITCCRQTWALVLQLLQYPQFKEFIIDAQSWVQVEQDGSVMDNSWMLLDLAHASINKGDLELCSALAPFVASAIHRLTSLGHDTRCWLSLLTTLTERSPESASCVLMLLAETVTKCPAIYLKDLLNTCAVIIEQKSSNVIAAKMLACSALQWLLYPSHTTEESLEVANSLLTAIDNTTSWGNHTARLCANKVFTQLRSMDERVDFSIELCKLVETWQNNPSSILPYLSRVSSSPPSFLEKLRLFLSAIFVDSFDSNEVKEKSFQLLLLLVRRNNELATSVVTVILYKLASEHQPHIQLELLRGLTAMAVQKENIALVVHSLESVRLKNSLKTLSVDLYLRLWKVECRCYPYLQKLLLEPASNERNDQTWEFEVARAVAISNICKTRPELYGEELVILLSQILNNCGDTWGSLPSSIALQGITSLCKAGIADIASTWRALAPKLSRDKRTAVVVSLCEFFAAIPSLHTPSIDYEKLVIEASTKLWIYVSTSNQLEVITAALRALSKFNLENLTLKSLPECYRQKLKLPSSYAKTPVDAARRPEDVLPYIPGECWIQLLQNIKPEALDAAGDMLACWIKVELTVYHSGMYQITGRGEPANYNHLHHRSICQAVTNYLCNQTQGTSQDVTRQCFRIISQSFTKPLPPLNWSFLQKFLDQSSEIRMHCLVVAARQAKISPSARRFMEGFLGSFKPSMDNKVDIVNLFTHLSDLCVGVPPNHLKPFIEKCLCFALENSAILEDKELEGKPLIAELFSYIKNALKKESIHDANRTMLSLVIEGMLGNFEADHEFFPAYVECAVELPTKYLERMTSPSVWWEVTPHKLRQSVGIRSALARRADSEVPLVWLNECIDATATLTGEQSTVLLNIAIVMCDCRDHETNCRWALELLGQIQSVINNKTNRDSQQASLFLCDVFILSVVVLSGYNCLALSLENVSYSRETRLQLFPHALVNLLACEQWSSITNQVVEWLHHMQTSDVITSLYANTFCQALVALRNSQYFKTPSVWMRILATRQLRTS